jgi:hypothetical protein
LKCNATGQRVAFFFCSKWSANEGQVQKRNEARSNVLITISVTCGAHLRPRTETREKKTMSVAKNVAAPLNAANPENIPLFQQRNV